MKTNHQAIERRMLSGLAAVFGFRLKTRESTPPGGKKAWSLSRKMLGQLCASIVLSMILGWLLVHTGNLYDYWVLGLGWLIISFINAFFFVRIFTATMSEDVSYHWLNIGYQINWIPLIVTIFFIVYFYTKT